MRILIANDDGIFAEGLLTLAKELEKEHEIVIVAPETQRSAQSHSITLFKPIVIKEVELEGIKAKAYSISGTPADCIRAGIEELFKDGIDLVVSGINMGLNSGVDILYSGTVSAAIEANLYGIPSIAVSAEWFKNDVNYNIAAKYTKRIINTLTKEGSLPNIVLNLNTPYDLNDEKKPIKVCRLGGPIFDYYLAEKNEEGERTLSVIGRKEAVYDEDTDRNYLAKGYATLTPLCYDFTNFGLMERIEDMLL